MTQKYLISGKGKKRSESCWKDSGPRPEAREEEKAQRKVAKVTPVLAGTHSGNLHQGELQQQSEAVDEDKVYISEVVHEN